MDEFKKSQMELWQTFAKKGRFAIINLLFPPPSIPEGLIELREKKREVYARCDTLYGGVRNAYSTIYPAYAQIHAFDHMLQDITKEGGISETISKKYAHILKNESVEKAAHLYENAINERIKVEKEYEETIASRFAGFDKERKEYNELVRICSSTVEHRMMAIY